MRPIRRPLAAALLLGAALTCLAAPALARDRPEGNPGRAGRWLKVRVYEHDAGTPTVIVNLPLKLVSAFVHMAAVSDTGRSRRPAAAAADEPGARHHRIRLNDLELGDVDLEALWKVIETMEPGSLVEIRNGDDRVDVAIE